MFSRVSPPTLFLSLEIHSFKRQIVPVLYGLAQDEFYIQPIRMLRIMLDLQVGRRKKSIEERCLGGCPKVLITLTPEAIISPSLIQAAISKEGLKWVVMQSTSG
jgi:hypothetical protein